MSTGQMVELCVHMCCGGCEAKVKKALLRVKGVDSVEVDMAMQKVTVAGWADQKKVLKAARKTGRRAVLWPYNTAAGEYGHNGAVAVHYSQAVHGGSGSYVQHPALVQHPAAYGPAPSSMYNYYKHGYDGDSRAHGNGRLGRGWSNNYGEKARAFFSDENPNACSVM